MKQKEAQDIHKVRPENFEDFKSLLKTQYCFDLSKSMKASKPLEKCTVCDSPIKCGVQLIRRCFMDTHDKCGGRECSCDYTKRDDGFHSCCYSCIVKILWTNAQKSSKSIGRYRGKCPYCLGEYCTGDIAIYNFENFKKKSKRGEKDRKKYTKKIKNFKNNIEEKELRFPSKLNGFQRKLIHEIAENFDLKHESKGSGNERYIVVSRK